jgi:hypothetical protein
MFTLDGLEPGPIGDDDLPLGPPLFAGPVFEPLAEPVVTALRAGDVTLGDASTHVALDVPTDLAAAYQASAGVAEAAHADQLLEGDDATAGLLVDAGAGVDAYRAAVLPHLPSPSADVVSDLVPPPAPPGELVGGAEPPEIPDVQGA